MKYLTSFIIIIIAFSNASGQVYTPPNERDKTGLYKLQQEEEIKSKTYDLKEHAPAQYNEFISKLQQSLLERLKASKSFPEWFEIAKTEKKSFTVSSTYSAHFKLVDYSRESINYGYYIAAGSKDIRSENKFSLISGDSSFFDYLEYASPKLPTTNYSGYTVMTEARVGKINLEYSKGITVVKIKDGTVNYKKFLPPTEIQYLITTELLKDGSEGIYEVHYIFGQALEDSFIKINKIKLKTTAGTILKTAGGLVLLTAAIVFL